MAEVFKFQRKDKAFFNVDIDGTLLTLPIGQSMSLELFEKIANITKIAQKAGASGIDNLERLESGVELGKCLLDLYKSVIPADKYEAIGFDTWSTDDLIALYSAWQNSAKVLQGMTLGESQASEGS
jgi:hypothetical protein